MTYSGSNRFAPLFEILSMERRGNSLGELAMIEKFIIPIPGINRDDFGNWYVRIGEAPVMWSCHTDTVHYHNLDDKEFHQKLAIDDDGFLYASNSSCLGADNGVGVFLMISMIEAGIEGLYIFHRLEEQGGQGSKYIATRTPELVEGIKFAIAFDRKGTQSVITHQGSRCCSDQFADSLIKALDLGQEKDTGGVFTDTANYTHLIPECTNISAGFYSEHTYQEHLNTGYVIRLLDAVLNLDINELVEHRKTDDPEDWGDYSWWNAGGYATYRTEKNRATSGTSEDFEFDYYLERIREEPEKVYMILKSWGLERELVEEMDHEQIPF